MAEILIRQNLLVKAQSVIDRLCEREGQTPQVASLYQRLKEKSKQAGAVPTEPKGRDSVALEPLDQTLQIEWEITEDGIALARRRARYSGKNILRIFSAVPGPRGVRTSIQDIEVSLLAAKLYLNGLPQPAVYVAAVGFLANTGEFVPLARSEPLSVSL